MATQSLPISLTDFHRLYDDAKPAYEYWYGEAVRKSMPTTAHGIVQYVLMMMLEMAGWNPASEVRLKVVSDVEPVPDVIAVQGKFRGRYPTAAPQLCVEILSPKDDLSNAFKKAGKYISWGTQCVWIVDPEKRIAWSLSQSAPEPVLIPSTGVLNVGETIIEMSALFARVDKKLDRSNEVSE